MQSKEITTTGEGIVVIDFGSQYCHLIARRIRELKVYSEIVPASASWESVQHINPKGIILSGGPASVYDAGAPRVPDWVLESAAGQLPVLGICYGMQALAHQLGGKVAPGQKREYGHALLHQSGAEIPPNSPLAKGRQVEAHLQAMSAIPSHGPLDLPDQAALENILAQVQGGSNHIR